MRDIRVAAVQFESVAGGKDANFRKVQRRPRPHPPLVPHRGAEGEGAGGEPRGAPRPLPGLAFQGSGEPGGG